MGKVCGRGEPTSSLVQPAPIVVTSIDRPIASHPTQSATFGRVLILRYSYLSLSFCVHPFIVCLITDFIAVWSTSGVGREKKGGEARQRDGVSHQQTMDTQEEERKDRKQVRRG